MTEATGEHIVAQEQYSGELLFWNVLKDVVKKRLCWENAQMIIHCWSSSPSPVGQSRTPKEHACSWAGWEHSWEYGRQPDHRPLGLWGHRPMLLCAYSPLVRARIWQFGHGSLTAQAVKAKSSFSMLFLVQRGLARLCYGYLLSLVIFALSVLCFTSSVWHVTSLQYLVNPLSFCLYDPLNGGAFSRMSTELFGYWYVPTLKAKERLPLTVVGPNPPLFLQEESQQKQQGGNPEPLLDLASVPLLETLFKPSPTFLVHP